MKKLYHVLLVDDDEDQFILLKELISEGSGGSRRIKLNLDWAASYEAALDAFRKDVYDAYLIDYRLGAHNGLELLEEGLRIGCRAPIIILTGHGSYDVDLAAMQAGAADYLVKERLSLPLLERSIRYAIEQAAARYELERRVQERTSDLGRANEELRAEIARREEIEKALRAANEELARARDALEETVADRTAELRRRADELQALQNATAALLTTLDLDELLPQILDAVRSALPAAEYSDLHLLQRDLNEVPRHLQQVVLKRRPLLVPDFHDLEGCEPLMDGGEPVVRSFRSLIAAPLVLEGRCIGVLSLGASRPNVFTPGDLRLLVSFAATTTAAIRNARLYDQAQRESITDSLTGLYNRRGLFALSEHEIQLARRNKRRPSVILFDIDRFKQVNDTYGHGVGDEVLRELAARVRDSIRSIDIFARYGGEEFAILAPDSNLSSAYEMAERLRQLVEAEPFETHRGLIPVTISLGVVEALPGRLDLAELLVLADTALYQAKQNGRNRTELFR